MKNQLLIRLLRKKNKNTYHIVIVKKRELNKNLDKHAKKL